MLSMEVKMYGQLRDSGDVEKLESIYIADENFNAQPLKNNP